MWMLKFQTLLSVLNSQQLKQVPNTQVSPQVPNIYLSRKSQYLSDFLSPKVSSEFEVLNTQVYYQVIKRQ